MATLVELYNQGYTSVRRKHTGQQINITSIGGMYKSELTPFAAISDDWEPVIEKTKKKVTLYRFLLKTSYGEFLLTNWHSDKGMKFPSSTILETQTKEVEYEE